MSEPTEKTVRDAVTAGEGTPGQPEFLKTWTLQDRFGDDVRVRASPSGKVWVDLDCEVNIFNPDKALKLAAAIRDAAVLAKE